MTYLTDWLGPYAADEWPAGICIREDAGDDVELLREAEHVRIGRGYAVHFELRQDDWIACVAVWGPTPPESEWLAVTRDLMVQFRTQIANIERAS